MVRGRVTSSGVASSNLLNGCTMHVVEHVKSSKLANSCLGYQGDWPPTNASRGCEFDFLLWQLFCWSLLREGECKAFVLPSPYFMQRRLTFMHVVERAKRSNLANLRSGQQGD